MIPITRVALCLAALSFAACGAPPVAEDPAESAAVTDHAGEINVKRPTVVAFFDTNSGRPSDGNEGEALSDFEHYASTASDTLRKVGVDFQVRYASSFRYRSGQVRANYVVPTGGSSVGYVLLVPGKPPAVTFGVMTDSDLVAWCQDLLVPA